MDISSEHDPSRAPAAPVSAAGFVAALRGLKEHSGLSLRQLEAEAARMGLHLSRSTVAGALARDTAPRQDVVVALLRVCLADRAESVEEWLAVYRALEETAPAPDAAADRPETGRGGRWRRRSLLWTGGSAALLAAAGLLLTGVLVREQGADAGTATGTRMGARSAPGDGPARASGTPPGGLPAGPVRIRASHSGLCLSELAEGDGSLYLDACATAFPPMSLVPGASGTYRVQTDHPVAGIGCMGIVNASKEAGARAGDDYCTPHDWIDFRFEAAPEAPDRQFRIVPTHTGMCLTVAHEAVRLRTPVQQSPCTAHDAEGQRFLIEPVA